MYGSRSENWPCCFSVHNSHRCTCWLLHQFSQDRSDSMGCSVSAQDIAIRARGAAPAAAARRSIASDSNLIVADVISFYVLPFVSLQQIARVRSCATATMAICDRGAADCFAQRTTSFHNGEPCMEINLWCATTLQSLRHTCVTGSRDIGIALANIISCSGVHSIACRYVPQSLFPRFEPGTCRELRSALFDNCGDDTTLAHIANVSSLEALEIHGDITDAGFVHLARLAALTSLDVRPTRMSQSAVSDAGIVHLVNLSRLTSLNIAYSRITDDSLAMIGRLTNLTALDLCSCRSVTNAGLAHIACLPHIRTLNLEECERVTDGVLVYFTQPINEDARGASL